MSSLERQSAERIDRILDAARSLIIETNGIGFTMKDVAARANVAPATPYNLLGSKDGLLYALLSRSLDALFIGILRYRAADPLEHPVEAGAFAADMFIRDGLIHRQVLPVFFGTRDELHRPWFMHRSMTFWSHSLEAAYRQKVIPPEETERDDLARLLMITFIGAANLWVHGDLDDEELRAQVIYGFGHIMLGFAEGASRKRMLAIIKEAQLDIPKHHSFLRLVVPSTGGPARAARNAIRLESQRMSKEGSAAITPGRIAAARKSEKLATKKKKGRPRTSRT